MTRLFPRSSVKTSLFLILQFHFKVLPSFLLLSLVWLSGCSPIYILRAAYEEGKILWRRESIEQVLERHDLDPETREKFRTVLAVREYGRDKLQLKVGGSYATYSYLDRPVLSYVLMAVPQTDLDPYTWWFLVVGRVPYKGFFSEEEAGLEADRFRGQGYDTTIRSVQAFSTLGWFDDPLLAHLLKFDKVTLAEVLFHELFHNTLFLSGAVDFNESLANFVGNRAAVIFFRDLYGEDSPEYLQAVQAWEEELEFSTFINRVATSLRDLYRGDLPKDEKLRLRQEIFSRSQEEWARAVRDRPTHQYRGYSQQEVNNAVIAHYILYLGGLELFESLYQAEGRKLSRLLELIRESVQDSEAPFEAIRGLLRKRGPDDLRVTEG
ncbi:MAG: aminopeptidase [Deltaproteobacteria bacterium]|nr:aminopeptidase [Deltaproteobacteria bacterium]